jgi:hypothetical protein
MANAEWNEEGAEGFEKPNYREIWGFSLLGEIAAFTCQWRRE